MMLDIFPNNVKPGALFREKDKAGVVVALATLDENNGERLPALKLVTVPLPPPPLPMALQVQGVVLQPRSVLLIVFQ
jgi:hypothetical protein